MVDDMSFVIMKPALSNTRAQLFKANDVVS